MQHQTQSPSFDTENLLKLLDTIKDDIISKKIPKSHWSLKEQVWRATSITAPRALRKMA